MTTILLPMVCRQLFKKLILETKLDLVWVLITLGVTLPSPAAEPVSTAKIGNFIIQSRDLERDFLNQTAVLKGDVKIVYNGQTLQADEVIIDQKRDRAILQGNVQIDTTEYRMGGSRIEIDYVSDQAVITNGFVEANSIRFQGQYIEKSSANQFYVLDADFTTCSNCAPTWSFQGSAINAKLGGYAYIKNAFLKVVGVPIFWIPYLVLPLKNERQTGLLTPEIGRSNTRGLTYTQSLFWAKSRSEDMTFTIKTYEHGGNKQLVEYRYAADDFSTGQINFSHIEDRVFYSSDRFLRYFSDAGAEKRFNRWIANGYFQHALDQQKKPSAALRLNLHLTSDLQTPKDFSDEYKNYSLSSLENRLNFTKQWTHSVAQVETSYYKHLLQANPTARNSVTVHRIPELRFDSTSQQIGDSKFQYKYSANYTNFNRADPYDDITVGADTKFVSNPTGTAQCEFQGQIDCTPVRDGIFNEGQDLIRAGQRFQLQTAVGREAFTVLDSVNIHPQLNYFETHYFFPVGRDREYQRRYFKFDLLSRSKLYRIFESDQADGTKSKYKHEFIPELQYTWIPWIDQKSHSFFGFTANGEAPFARGSAVDDRDINSIYGIQYDYDDRIYDRHLISLTLLNRVVRRKHGDPLTKDILNFKVIQSYDVYQATQDSNRGQPLSKLEATTSLYLDEFTIGNQLEYYHYDQEVDSNTSLTFLNQDQQYFKIGYRAKRSSEPTQDDVSFSIGFVTNYVNLLTGVVVDASPNRTSDSRLTKHSMIAQLKPPGECWAINFYRNQKIGAEAEWTFKFDFSWDGNPPKIIPPAELNLNY